MKVIGIGETVFDIIFDSNNQPLSANPGGSVYNAMISIGRYGHKGTFISEVGNDHVGAIIRQFLRDNGIDDSCVSVFNGTRSPLSLAFLDDKRDAQYQFYKDPASQRIAYQMPPVDPGDVMLYGSYFALNQAIRPEVLTCLKTGRAKGALLYYDINFRAAHAHERDKIMSTATENMQLAHIVKASNEDIKIMFDTEDWHQAYREHIQPFCPYFICTEGPKGATLLHPNGELHIEAQKLTPISTIGAGDNFNAGIACALLDAHITAADDIPTAHFIDALYEAMRKGIEFSSEVCQTLSNYIAPRIIPNPI